ncbi:MAG TPA: helix-turn-helix domain-containing protein, partial [Firmicutes bacterium]|nr:helix-turn-helix domain-containing protein [Bacillota bacterium]
MGDKQGEEKTSSLRAHHALNPHPERVADEAFRSGNRFFDPRDLVQVKYEMLRRADVDGLSVKRAAASFGLSRPTFYQAREAFRQGGLPGLLSRRPGPRGAHKFTEEVLSFLESMLAEDPSLRPDDLAQMVKERFRLSVHPR